MEVNKTKEHMMNKKNSEFLNKIKTKLKNSKK